MWALETCNDTCNDHITQLLIDRGANVQNAVNVLQIDRVNNHKILNMILKVNYYA